MNTPAPRMTPYDRFILACTVLEVKNLPTSTPAEIQSVADEFRRCYPEAKGWDNDRIFMVCANIIA